MTRNLKSHKVTNLLVEKLIREASDNFSYNRDYELALEQVERALKIDHDNVKALILKGDILFCIDMDENALECFETAIKIDPTSAEAYGSKAGTLDVLGRQEEALCFCEKAFEFIKPKDKFLLTSLFDQKIALLIRMKRFEEAKRNLNLAIKTLNDEDADYLFNCYKVMIENYCRLRQKKLAKAEKLSLKVI